MNLKKCLPTIILLFLTAQNNLFAAEIKNCTEEEQKAILKKSLTSFLQKNSILSPKEYPYILISPKVKNFSYVDTLNLNTVRMPLKKTLECLNALEFFFLHEVGHSVQIYQKSTQEDEFDADAFAAKHCTSDATCTSFIKHMLTDESKAESEGYEMDSAYPDSRTRSRKILKIRIKLAKNTLNKNKKRFPLLEIINEETMLYKKAQNKK